MSTAAARPSTMKVGDLLRVWRQRRRISQLRLSLDAEVSARHLSFVETGRARPSRELLLHLAQHLDVPLRERNALLLAAGYAPVFHQTQLEADEMVPVRAALERIIRGHDPYPAVVVDRCWDIVTANDAAMRILTAGVAAHLLAPRPNALRVTLHPDGLASRIENLAQWAHHLLDRLDRQIEMSGATDLVDLADELRGYPTVSPNKSPGADSHPLFVPLILRHGDHRLELVSTIATFGTALDITVAELAIESFFPANSATATALVNASTNTS